MSKQLKKVEEKKAQESKIISEWITSIERDGKEQEL